MVMFYVAMHFKKRPVDGSKIKHSYFERRTNMARQVYADNVDANGKVFDTVGENIRKGARAGELIDFSTIIDKLDALDPEISTFRRGL